MSEIQPDRPTQVVDRFHAKCRMGVVGLPAAEGTLLCDMPNERTRFEAFGGWNVTRFDLHVQAMQYVPSNPPDVKLHEEPAMCLGPPEDAVFEKMENVDGKDCQKWAFKNVGSMMTVDVALWVSVNEGGVATPVKLQQATPTQTIEIAFVTLEPVESFDDSLFAIEQYIPAERPSTVSVRGVMTNQAGERVHGVAVNAIHPDNSKVEWTARTAAQSDEKGEFELLLTPNRPWQIRVQGAPRYGARIFEVVPPDSGINPGGAVDVVLEPATAAPPALGNPAATNAGASTVSPEMAQMIAAQQQQQAAMARGAVVADTAAALMAAMAMQGQGNMAYQQQQQPQPQPQQPQSAAQQPQTSSQSAQPPVAQSSVGNGEKASSPSTTTQESNDTKPSASPVQAQLASQAVVYAALPAGAARKVELSQRMAAKSLSTMAEKYSVGRTGFFSNWKKRWFEQKGAAVQYYEKAGGKYLGTIPINKTTKIHRAVTPSIHPQASKPEQDIVIEFTENGKPLKLLVRFENAQAKTEWSDHLCDIQELMALTS
jgi:hypothetical protein